MREQSVPSIPLSVSRHIALSDVSRALGLAQSIEHPIIVPLDNGTRAVASEIVVLLTAVREHLLRAEA